MRILLVDDAAILRALFTRIATSLGHAVVGEAHSSAGALDSARALAPDAIVVDGRLGGGDLTRFLRDLRQAAPCSTVLIVAAVGEAVPVRLARDGVAAGLLRRPFSRAQIRDVLDACETGHPADPA